MSVVICKTAVVEEIKNEVLRLMLRAPAPDAHWREHNFVENGLQFIDRLSATEYVTYTTIRELGRADDGVAYTAVKGAYTDAQISTGAIKADCILKRHFRRTRRDDQPESIKETQDRAEREIAISIVLESVHDRSRNRVPYLCEKDVQCAKNFFTDGQTVITIFPLTNGVPLREFVRTQVNPLYATDAVAAKILVLEVVTKLTKIVADMNSIGVFHRSIKAENVVVSFNENEMLGEPPEVLSVRLVNMSESCAFLDIGLQEYLAEKYGVGLAKNATCSTPGHHRRYEYTHDFIISDPASIEPEHFDVEKNRMVGGSYPRIFSRDEAKKYFPYFEGYACALLTQRILEPGFSERRSNNINPIVETERSTPHMTRILKEMVGPIEGLSPARDVTEVPELDSFRQPLATYSNKLHVELMRLEHQHNSSS